jgi:hypothetical protein
MFFVFDISINSLLSLLLKIKHPATPNTAFRASFDRNEGRFRDADYSHKYTFNTVVALIIFLKSCTGILNTFRA